MTQSIDAAEIDKFAAMAQSWWDPRGQFRPLHEMNPCRLDYIVSQIAAQHGRDMARARALEGLAVLDVGCGGGLLSEPMARLGADVTGIDAEFASIEVAKRHAEAQGLGIDYRHTTAEALAQAGADFDVVLAFEVIEHVTDPAAFIATCARLVRPGGLLICSTLNRTAKSFALAIVGAEWVLGWLPRGTHDWNRFLKPSEVGAMLSAGGLRPVDRTGMVYDPLRGQWSLSPRDLGVNYAVTATQD